jgi:PAS domain-containing protein
MENRVGSTTSAGGLGARRILVADDQVLDLRVAQAILDALFTFIGLFSTDGVIVGVNRAPLQASGLRREDVLGRRFVDLAW